MNEHASLTSKVRIAALAVLALCAAGTAIAGPPPFPETPAGTRAAELLDLFNRGGADADRRYVENGYAPSFREAFPMEQHLGMIRMTRDMFPDLALGLVGESSPTAIAAWFRSPASGEWLHLELEVEADAPHRILSLGLRPGEPPEGATDPEPGPAAPAVTNFEELDSRLSRRAADDEFSGVVLAARGREVVFHEVYGPAHRAFGVPNRLDTRFNIGSLNKLFTSVAIAQLAEKGKLGLDDPLGRHLDGFPPEAAGKVTIRHLLQMRSGWGDYWDNETYLAARNELRTVGDYLAFLKEEPLQFEPGTDETHSNTGFEILGAVIEKVSGLDYYDYVRRHIYGPAGMTRSDSYHRDGPATGLATGYTNLNAADPLGSGYRWTNTFMLSPRGTPAGGGYATAMDLLRFRRALCGHRLLGEAWTNLLLRRFEGEPAAGDPPKGTVALAGGAPGVNALFVIDLDDGWTVVVLSNFDMPAAMMLEGEMMKLIGK